MNPTIQKLAEYFEKLPGIGPRQAQRFCYFLLNKDREFLTNFSKEISKLKQEIFKCDNCQRFSENTPCSVCQNLNRDKTKLLIVEKDIDLENLEKAGFYNGHYFVLGGLIPAIGLELPKEVKMRELFEKVKKSATTDLREVILAFNATPEGENASRYTEKILEPIIEKTGIKISRLGHGLSTGTELEYADSNTLKNAFEIRH